MAAELGMWFVPFCIMGVACKRTSIRKRRERAAADALRTIPPQELHPERFLSNQELRKAHR